MKKIICIFFIYIFVSVSQAEIYKWVDEQGKTHYGDKPVENSEELKVNVENSGNLKASKSREDRRKKLIESFDDDRSRENKEKSEYKKQKEKIERNCVLAKDRLRRYERASSLYNLDTGGNRVTVSNEIRQKDTEELRKKIKKYCK